MELEQFSGSFYGVQQIEIHGRLAFAKIGGTWYALNARSKNPLHLRNRSERSTWALSVGVRTKDVENFVQREKRRIAKEKGKELLREAMLVINAAGYTVLAPKEKGDG